MTGFPIFSGKVVGARRAMGDYSAIVKKQETDVWAENEYGETIADGEAGVDDAEVIQSAVNITGRILIKSGVYILDKPITLPSNTCLEGEGWDTILKAKDGFTGSIIYNKDWTNGNENIILRNFQLDGNKANCPDEDYGILLDNVTNGLVEKVFVHDIKLHGVVCRNGQHNYIINCIAKNNDRDGFKIGDPSAPTYYGLIMGCTVENCGDTGLIIKSSPYSSIIGSISKKCKHGIILDGETPTQDLHVSVVDCITSENRNHGIFVHPEVKDFVISGCISEKNQFDGMYIQGTHGVIIGCISKNNNMSSEALTYDGIKLDGATRILIMDCLIYRDDPDSNQQWAIREFSGDEDYNVFIGNVMYGHLQGGGKKGIVIKGTNSVAKYNIGHVTENPGTATFSGDGSTTDFLIGDHGLAITDPNKIIVKVTPISADAIAASPCVSYVDPNDNTKIRVKFASAPASGTDNVKIIWEAQVVR